MNNIRQRLSRQATHFKEGAIAKKNPSGWILPKQKSSFGEEDDW